MSSPSGSCSALPLRVSEGRGLPVAIRPQAQTSAQEWAFGEPLQRRGFTHSVVPVQLSIRTRTCKCSVQRFVSAIAAAMQPGLIGADLLSCQWCCSCSGRTFVRFQSEFGGAIFPREPHGRENSLPPLQIRALFPRLPLPLPRSRALFPRLRAPVKRACARDSWLGRSLPSPYRPPSEATQ